ncbi:MAG: hypothetical protein IH933_15095 [Euryarchaeota archaeon]|nr:hypothetical protein [Euryarchaeota archaeon]
MGERTEICCGFPVEDRGLRADRGLEAAKNNAGANNSGGGHAKMAAHAAEFRRTSKKGAEGDGHTPSRQFFRESDGILGVSQGIFHSQFRVGQHGVERAGGVGREAGEEVAELDLNPVFAYPDGAIAVDARVVLAEA